MEVDMHGFDCLATPLSLSPISRHPTSSPSMLTPEVVTQAEVKQAVVTPKPLFQTPVEKPAKKFKRKRVAKYRLVQVKE
jgi:hypothetical protein